jgi:hypothetical protein
MKVISVTVHATGGLEIQDPFPAEGRLVVDILPGGAATFAATTGQYNRIRPQLDAAVTAGIITALLVNETDAERTDQYMETKKVVPPGPRTGYGRYFTGLDGNPYFETELGAIITLAVAGGSAITFIGTIANAGQFPLVGVAKSGWLYLMVGNATDPVTGASFTTDDEIIWNGTAWSLAGVKRGQTVVDAATMGPIYTVLDADEMLIVDVSAAPITLDLPVPTGKQFKRYEIIDGSSNAATNNITITVGGVPFAVMDVDGQYAAAESDGTTWLAVSNQSEVGQNTYHRRGTGMDHSAVTAHDNRLLAIGSGAELFEDASQAVSAPGATTVRSFRAVSPGAIAGLVAECGAIPAVGESMAVDVTINTVSACTTRAILDAVSSPAPGTPVAAVINPLAAAYLAGDLIEIVYTYVAGGGPTPIINTISDLEIVRA